MRVFAGVDIEKIKTASIKDLCVIRAKFISAYISRLEKPDAIYGTTAAGCEVRKIFDAKETSKPLNNYLYLKANAALFDIPNQSKEKEEQILRYLLGLMQDHMPEAWGNEAVVKDKMFTCTASLNKTSIKELYDSFMQQNLKDAHEELDYVTSINKTTVHAENLPYALALEITNYSAMLQLIREFSNNDPALWSLYDNTSAALKNAAQLMLDIPEPEPANSMQPSLIFSSTVAKAEELSPRSKVKLQFQT